MNTLLKNPLFLTGLLIRLIMLCTILPKSASQWYIPFLNITTSHLSWNPWKVFLASGGTDIAFPYGYAMWIAFLPMSFLSHLLGFHTYYGYGLTLLGADIALLFILQKLFTPTHRLLVTAYWLSPIILFSTYWLGLNDLIPVALLCFALYFVKNLKPLHSGIFCSLAISAKLSMILAVPFFIIYFFRNRGLRSLLPSYLTGFFITLVLMGFPFLLSQDGVYMLVHNPEMKKVYELGLHIGQNTLIYLLPMIYLLMLYLAWHIRRVNFELLNVLFGLSFFLVVLLTPASPGWFIWIMPLLIFYQIKKGKIASMLVIGFTLLYVANQIALMMPSLTQKEIALLQTFLITFGVILVFRIWVELIQFNDYFRISRKPFVIGISGDSGSGKDTLTTSLQGLFGRHSVTTLSGDDYHLWDRQKPIWQVMTHLNPRANDLEQYAQDLIALTNGKTIFSRHYNHENGKMTFPHRVKSNDFIIASGLHALSLPLLRNCYDLTIYLDINEELRRYLKLQRDVNVRGHTIEKVLLSLNEREEDSKQFVKPQAMHADLILSLQPIHPRILDNIKNTRPLRLKLWVCSRRGLNEESLFRVLVGICGLHVDMRMSTDSDEVTLSIEGETTADDIALAAKNLLPRISDFLDILPRWEDGVRGLMQLIILSHINQSLSERLLW